MEDYKDWSFERRLKNIDDVDSFVESLDIMYKTFLESEMANDLDRRRFVIHRYTQLKELLSSLDKLPQT